jgi:diguanylate cyclase (GGDEF)-like protein
LLKEKQQERRKNLELSSENKVLNRRIAETEEKADHDALTGLLNREGFEKVLVEIRKTGRSGALLMIDIDKFKDMNDTYGHPIGDLVLKAVARRLQAMCRELDMVVRWGGEEFILFFPNTTAEEVLRKFTPEGQQGNAAINIKFKRSDSNMPTPEIEISFSGGVTDLGVDEKLDDAMARVDKALYHVKETGRNRLEMTGKGPATP